MVFIELLVSAFIIFAKFGNILITISLNSFLTPSFKIPIALLEVVSRLNDTFFFPLENRKGGNTLQLFDDDDNDDDEE